MAVSPKIIYLEADEEVTSVVDKLRKTEFKKVVLVIPKEASLLQSVVNLKLLKRQAENLEKSLAVVTHDKVGKTLAEKVGILASSKLEDVVNEAEFIPIPAEKYAEEVKIKDSNNPLADTNEVIFKKSKSQTDDREDEVFVKETAPEETENWDKKAVESYDDDNLMPKLPKKKIAAIFGVILIILLGLGYIYIPRARATILVKAERKPVSIEFSGSKDASLDTEKTIIPIRAIEATKELNKKFPATGKKNAGEKATGNLWISTPPGQDVDWVSGTRFSPQGSSLVYKTTSPVHVTGGSPKIISVEASEPGEKYNGFGNNQPFILTSGSHTSALIVCQNGMSGGTTKEVTYVTQGDINSAKDSLSKDATDEATTDFNKQAEEIKVIDETKKTNLVSSSAEPGVNSEATEFTMTVKVEVEALGYNLNDISSLIKAEVERQLGFSKNVVDDGAAEATITIENSDLEKGTVSGSIKTDSYVSTKMDENQLKDELLGLNSIKAKNYLEGLEGVEETRFEFFPSFIKSFPRIKNQLFIKIEVADKENL